MGRFTLFGLALVSATCMAGSDSYRLAFSKAEKVEVFVDHPVEQAWCSPSLNLRFAFNGAVSEDAIARLLPRLGGLLASQCPAAQSLNWRSSDEQLQFHAYGTATRAGDWEAVFAGSEAKLNPTTVEPSERSTRRQAESVTPTPDMIRLATTAEVQLKLFGAFEILAGNPRQLVQQRLSDIDGEARDYVALMRGERRKITQIVHLRGSAGEVSHVDYPYEAELRGRGTDPAPDGWYLVSGELRLDTARLDSTSLPLTVIEGSEFRPCAAVGCTDLFTALALTRERLGMPDWLPEDARAQVRAVWPDRYPEKGELR